MTSKNKEIRIPESMLKAFGNEMRVVALQHTSGIPQINEAVLAQLEKKFPGLGKVAASHEGYHLALAYRGTNLEADMEKFGLNDRSIDLSHRFPILGIPIPWPLLENMRNQVEGFEFMLTP